MINKETNFVQAYNIDEFWRETLQLCIAKGVDDVVLGGSYVGQIRKQLPFFSGRIINPGHRTLSPLPPPGVPCSTSEDKIESYFLKYLMSSEVEENEVYTYGSFIEPQLDRCIQLLNDSNGKTNQASITVGDVSTTFLDDPPCLRSISFKVINDRLQMTVYFRSWDLYAGLPENLGGLQLLKEYVLETMDVEAADGDLVVFSDGAHIYSQYFDIINTLCVEKIVVSETALRAKEDFHISNGE